MVAATSPAASRAVLALPESLLLAVQQANTSGQLLFAFSVPNDPAFLGFEALYQAFDPAAAVASPEFAVDIGR